MNTLTLKRPGSFQNLNNRQATHTSTPRPLIFKLQRKVLKFNDICVRWGSSKADLVTNFLNPENRSFENVSIETFKNLFIFSINLYIFLIELNNIH